MQLYHFLRGRRGEGESTRRESKGWGVTVTRLRLYRLRLAYSLFTNHLRTPCEAHLPPSMIQVALSSPSPYPPSIDCATDEHKTVNIDFSQNGGDEFSYNPGHNQPTNGYSRTVSKSVHTTRDVSNFSKKSIEIRHQREKVKLFQQERNHQWKLVRRSILTLPGDDLEQELQPPPPRSLSLATLYIRNPDVALSSSTLSASA